MSIQKRAYRTSPTIVGDVPVFQLRRSARKLVSDGLEPSDKPSDRGQGGQRSESEVCNAFEYFSI